MKTTLIAKKSLVYGGIRVAQGEQFEARRIDARALVAVGSAQVREAEVLQEVDSDDQAETAAEPTNPKRTYQRRDLKATK